jgi:hypothetical protein
MAKKPQPEPLPASTSEQAANDPLIIARESIAGDMRDFILDRLKNQHNPLPWNMRKESEQREMIYQVTEAVNRMVQRVVDIIAADGKPTMRGTLVKVLVKDGLKCQVDFLSSDPLRHELIDAQGETVMLALADSSDYMGTRGDVKINKDQGSLLGDDDLPGDPEPPQGPTDPVPPKDPEPPKGKKLF